MCFFRVNTVMVNIESNPVSVVCLVEDKKVSFEIDSGSYLSTISVTQLDNLNVRVRPTKKRAKGYGNSEIKFLGEIELKVSYNGVFFPHVFLVVNKNHTALLGRDLCQKLGFMHALPLSLIHI